MREVSSRLFVGSEEDCFRDLRDNWAVVHACKNPCHARAVGYRGSLASDHPEYLLRRDGRHLYMNLIDPEAPLFKEESFSGFRSFASDHYTAGSDLLIHCNQGESRAPSLALLFLAKEICEIPDESYRAARRAYEELDPLYAPGLGIQKYFRDNWAVL